MARSSDQLHESAYSKVKSRRAPKARLLRWRNVFLLAVIVFVGVLAAVPMLLSNAGLVTRTANQYAGIEPLHIEIGDIEVGWFSPLKISDVRILDDKGAELLRVGELETQSTLTGMATDYTNLRNIFIRQVRLAIDVQPNTTSLEEALKPLLAKWAQVPLEEVPTDETATPSFRGTIQVEDATILARDSVTLRQWELTVSEAIVPIPEDFTKVPDVSLIGRIAEVDRNNNLVLHSTGQFSVKVEPGATPTTMMGADSAASSQMHLALNTSGMPLDWVGLVKRRLSWLPIETLSGSATVQAMVDIQSPSSLIANINTAQIDQLKVVAPSLLGNSGAALNQVRLVGNIHLNNEVVQSDQLQLTSDVGYIRASAKTPLNIQGPSLTQPWIEGADFTVDGEIDIVKLLQVAPELIPMRDDAKLSSGKATLSLRHTQDPTSGELPNAFCDIRLGNLQAQINGASLRWDEALQLTAQVKPSKTPESGLAEFRVNCVAEFCDIQGSGTLTQGQLAANIDFDKLEKRLSQWIAVPTESLAGNANASLTWKQQDKDRIIANATIDTTPLTVVLPTGKLDEPAWKGEVGAALLLNGMEVVQVDRIAVNLRSASERIELSTSSPLRLATLPAGSPPAHPTSLSANIQCDLASVLNRARVIAGVDLGMAIAGTGTLQFDSSVVNWVPNIQSATYQLNDFRLTGEGYAVNEPRIQGKYRGNLDPMNLASMQIDELVVQAESLAITARDAAATQTGYLRSGQAAFRIDPSRLMKSLESPTSTPNSGTMTYAGDISGQMQWLLNAEKVDWQIGVDAKNLVVNQSTPNSTATTLVSTAATAPGATTALWSEPQVRADARGSYMLGNGAVDIPEATVQTEWIAMAAASHYESSDVESVATCKGKLTYDMATVMQRLKPFVGDYAKVQGQRTEPFEVTWRSSPSSGSWAESLTANTTLGWDQASIVGIVLGQGSVPLTINQGLAATKTEIPMSQGILRWDLQSNLAADKILIVQKPERVLDHVAITPEMCKGWLKYLTPLLSEVASVQGLLSLDVEKAEINPIDYLNQTISGKLMIHGATVGPGPLSNQLIGIARQVRAMRKGMTLDVNTINDDLWLQMPEQNISFAMKEGTISHKDVQMKIGDVAINTSGAVALDGTLQMVAQIPIQQSWIAENQMLSSLAGQTINIPVVGTLQQPRVDLTALTSVSKQLISAAAQQAMQKQVDKGLNKILGPLQNQLEPLQQQIQSLPQQLPSLPQLPQFPSFGLPGFSSPQ